MNQRYSPHLSITLPPELIRQVADYQQQYGLKRSTIIQMALYDWLAKQAPKVLPTDQPLLVAGQPYDPDKSLKDYQRPDMSGEILLQTLLEFEAAEARHYTKT